MASDQFDYPPLRRPLPIRLLRIKGLSRLFTNPNGPLRTKLFEISLENPPSYEAISYTWDQQQADQPLRCNNKRLHVTANAISALKAVRLQGQDRVVWIDSICINQSSVADKNTQVPLMGRIYKKAKQTLVWLGRGTFVTDTAFDFLRDLVDISRLPVPEAERKRLMQDHNSRFETVVTQHRRVPIITPGVSFVGDVLALPWFHRMWTVQELVIAQDGLLICGQKHMQWYRFLDGLAALKDLEGLAAIENNGAVSFNGVWLNGGALYHQIDLYRRLRGMVRHANEIRSAPGEQPVCCMILQSPRQRLASDPRDKIYGVYGILEEMGIKDLPLIDYNNSVRQVYTEMTRACIVLDRSLRLLNQISAFPTTAGLPSWVPDWADSTGLSPLFTGLVHATKESPCLYSFESNDRLTLSGLVIDVLSSIAKSNSVSPGRIADTEEWAREDNAAKRRTIMRAEVQTMQEWLRVGRQLQAYATGERLQDAFCMTITQNGTAGDTEDYCNPSSFLEDFDVWHGILSAGQPGYMPMEKLLAMVMESKNRNDMLETWKRTIGLTVSDLADAEDEVKISAAMGLFGSTALYAAALANSIGRTFFTTVGNYMGIGPRSSRSGDAVALFSGLKLPFVVRKHHGSYRILGPAFIHGIMYGERWPDDVNLLENMSII